MESTTKSCFHCGDPCPNNAIHIEEKYFCCNGCKTVYELLSEHNLDTYYNLEENPGYKPLFGNSGKYNYLDEKEIEDKLLDFNEGSRKRIRIFLPEIHCSSCIYLLENLGKINKGVLRSEVNFVRKSAHITFDAELITLRELAELLDRIGYVPHFETKDEKERLDKANRKFLYRLGLTFFCFSNIMLFSFPEYLNPDNSFQEFQTLFSYLVLAFSLPILFFSAREYFVSAFKALRSKSVNLDVPISLGILALYIKSIYEIFLGNGPGYMDSFAGFVLFLFLGKWFQNKTYQALSFERDYLSYFPMASTTLVDGVEKIVPIEKLKAKDVVLIHNSEIIPADSILMSADAKIDYSFVTGESTPIEKKSGEQLFAGGRLIGERIEITLTKEVENSYLTQLWNESDTTESKVSNKANSLKERTDKLSYYFIIAVLTVAALTGLIWYFIDAPRALEIVTAVLIVACPCALALSVPFTFGNAMRAASRNRWFLKNSDAIEQMAFITDIVFDKTGTITENTDSNIEYVGKEMSEDTLAVLSTGIRNSNHPLSKILFQTLLNGYPSLEIHEYQEIEGKGLTFKFGSDIYKAGSSTWTNSQSIDEKGSKVYISINDRAIGCYLLRNRYRSRVLEVIEKLNTGYELHLLSGDNNQEKEFLSTYFKEEKNLNFQQDPLDKLKYIKKLRGQGKRVLMVGDGLNDAGALLESDVGISVSEGVYNFSPACDGIVKADRLYLLPTMLNLGKYSLKVLKFSYLFSLFYNLVGLFFATQGMLTPLIAAILMPLSSISIVILTTVTISSFERRFIKN